MSGMMAHQQWLQRMDGNGIPFWVNQQTGMSTYIMPTMNTGGIPSSSGMYPMPNQRLQGMHGHGMNNHGMNNHGMNGHRMQGGVGQDMGVMAGVPGVPGVGGMHAVHGAMGPYPPPGVAGTPFVMADRPGQWKRKYDDDGGKYWVHSITGEVSSRNPFVIQACDFGTWERKYDGDGGKFWMNTSTGEVSREDPYM